MVVSLCADEGHVVYLRLGLPLDGGGKPRVVITEWKV